MNDTMQAISQTELGGPEVLQRVTLPIRRPASARSSFESTPPASTRSTPWLGRAAC